VSVFVCVCTFFLCLLVRVFVSCGIMCVLVRVFYGLVLCVRLRVRFLRVPFCGACMFCMCAVEVRARLW